MPSRLALCPCGSRFALAARASPLRLARARRFYFALQNFFSIKSNHQPQYMWYHYTNKLLGITIFLNIYTVINERRKIRGKFAPILEQCWEGQTEGANLPAGKKRGFRYKGFIILAMTRAFRRRYHTQYAGAGSIDWTKVVRAGHAMVPVKNYEGTKMSVIIHSFAPLLLRR